MSDEDRKDTERRRSLAILGHLMAPAASADDPSNAIFVSLTSAGPEAPGSVTVRIGDVSLVVPRPPKQLAHYVPALYLAGKGREDQDVLRALRFMLQKDSLGQDVYLIGPPGPLRRRIALKYAELTKRTVEYVALSQDTTESDLKQRREISGGTAKYVDCAATRAAINGSLLILDGIEKAERNVLVVLNNLLENREMALEDGRFLVSPKRYDALLKEHSSEELETWRLVRTSDKFRVLALGLPVPRYVGSTLDPPFRSRFQARDVQGPRITDQLSYLQSLAGPAAPDVVIRSLVQAAAVIREMRESDGTSVSPTAGLPEFPQGFEDFAGSLLSIVPEISAAYIASFLFPHSQLLKGVADDRLHLVSKVFRRFGVEDLSSDRAHLDGLGEPEDTVKEELSKIKSCSRIRVTTVKLNKERTGAVVDFAMTLESPVMGTQSMTDLTERTVSVRKVRGGGSKARDPGMDHVFVATDSTEDALTRMCLAHACGADICLIGEKGGGKSRLTQHFAGLFGFRVEHIPLYKDVSARQLLQRRSTLANGDTIWEDSALVRAALGGRLAILDGIEQMIPGTLATLQELVVDRECRLPDGRRLIDRDRFDFIAKRDGLTEAELRSRGVEIIHPAFRIIALARPANLSGTSAQQARGAWLLPELQTMFRFVFLSPMPPAEQAGLIHSIAPNVTAQDLDKLNQFAKALREAVRKDETLSALESTVSLRQTARVCRRLSTEKSGDGVAGVLRKSLLSAALDRFLPPLTREAFHSVLDKSGIVDADGVERANKVAFEKKSDSSADESWRIKLLPPRVAGATGLLQVGTTAQVDVFPPRDPLLVPSIVFFDNPRQTSIMADMLRDWQSGQHLLLIGNQGVGKNKLADRMLQLLQLPREYIQLHRDTTVQNLTSNPTIVNGRLMYEDSPLVKAAKFGRVLVVDEADKAPTYVTAVLKALVEDRSMLLSDGRRVVDASHVCENEEEEAEIIRLHPEFRVIALANRPGFPFHGNDFFREVGDVFACHAIDNPDFESEIYLMREYGPSVPADALRRLVAAFDELRTLSDEGKLSYPYSTRELAAVVKHMERFPEDGVDKILRNVFDFDSYAQDEREILIKVFAKHGVPFSLGNDAFQVRTGLNRNLRSPRLLEFWEEISRKPATTAVAAFSTVARFNHGSGTHTWKLRSPMETGNLTIEERSGTVFSEERYSFKLPRSSILGCCQLDDGKLVAVGRSSTFVLHLVDSGHARYQTFDVFASMPSDGTYRTSPKLASVVPISGMEDWVVIAHQEGTYLLAVNVKAGDDKPLIFFEQLPGVTKGGGKVLACERSIGGKAGYFQRGETFFGVLDFATQKNSYVKLDFFVQDAFTIGVNQWLIVEKGSNAHHMLRIEAEGAVSISALQRRDEKLAKVTIGKVKLETVATFPLANPPGNVQGDARTIVYADGSIGFAADMALNGAQERARFYHIQESENLADRGPVRAVRGLAMGGAQLLAVARERVDVFTIDLDVYDLTAGKFRTIAVGLEDDALSQSPASLRSFAQPGVLNRPLTSLSPSDLSAFSLFRQAISDVQQRIFLLEHMDGESLMTVDCMGRVRVWFVTELSIRRAFADWRKVVGNIGEADAFLKVTIEDDQEPQQDQEGDGEGNGKGSGKGKGTGEGEGEGEGNGKGNGEGNGEGEGQQGRGQGGKGGPVSKGGGAGTGSGKGKKKLEEVSELPDPGEYKATPLPNPAALEPGSRGPKGGAAGSDDDPAVKAATQELKKQVFDDALKKIGMTEFDAKKYEKYTEAVKTEIRELRSILDSLESKEHERIWHKNQQVGDLDDQKLIDGLTGDRSIYKRRKDVDPDNPFFQPKPKRLSFVFDVSMSMSRYASDGRLERSLEAAVMIMESLKGFERKFDYRVVGHSGDTDELVFVPWGKPPANDKARLDVIRGMHAHTEMCDSGDHTLEAAKKAIFDCAGQKEADDRFVFLVSDANLDQYSITPEMISRLFDLDKRVHVFVLFIASMRDAASSFAKRMPGNVFVCLDKKELPRVMKRMFLAAASKGS